MTNNNQKMFESLGEIKEYCLDYEEYIITEKQVELIKEIYSELEDLNEDIWVKRNQEEIYPIELDTIVTGSFEGEDIFEILYSHGCNYSYELTVFKSFNLKYKKLTKINDMITKNGMCFKCIDHNFW